MRGLLFQRMFELCHKEGQLSTIIDNVKKVDQISEEWQMSVDERRSLYKSASHILDQTNET
jgi:hypothetical protein